MHFFISHIEPRYPKEVAVHWEFDPDGEMVAPVHFFLERSGSPKGPFDKLQGPLSEGTLVAVDSFTGEIKDQANLLSLNRSMCYRIRAEDSENNVAYTSPVDLDNVMYPSVELPIPTVGYVVNDKFQPIIDPLGYQTTLPGVENRHQLLFRRKLLREHFIHLKLQGITIYVIKKKHWGAACSCVDKLTKGQTLYDCSICHGAGWVGGYYTPIKTRGVFYEAPTASTTTNIGPTTQTTTNMLMMPAPRVYSKDIIVEASTNRRWVVTQPTTPELKRMQVSQQVHLTELSRDSTEYAIPLNDFAND